MTSIQIQSENIDIINYLKNDFTMHPKKVNLILEENQDNNILTKSKTTVEKDFNEYISNLIANVILQFIDVLFIRKILNLDYSYFTSDEKEQILKDIKLSIQDENIDEVHFSNLLVFPIQEYLYENDFVNIDGLVNFRLKGFKSYIENIVEMKVHDFVINQEYLRFVNLIKDYVNSKLPEYQNVNLIYYNENSILLTQNGDTIKLDNFNSVYLSDISFSNNDYVLNTLVGLLPANIKIHCKKINPNDQFIKTVQLIFGNRVCYCNGCNLCNSFSK